MCYYISNTLATVQFSSVCSVCETWRAGWKWLLERFGEEVEVFTAMKRNRHLRLTGLAQLITPLEQRQTEQICHTSVAL